MDPDEPDQRLYPKVKARLFAKHRSVPEDGVMGVMGVAIIPLALSAAICCICTAATVATGDRYADWATRACCWTSCRYNRKARRGEGRGRRESEDKETILGVAEKKKKKESTEDERKDVEMERWRNR